LWGSRYVDHVYLIVTIETRVFLTTHSDIFPLLFSHDQGDNVVRALQSMLQQAKVALKPGNKSCKSKSPHPTTPPTAATVDKRALACGIIALLQHSCTLAAAAVPNSAANNDLSSLVSEALVDGMRQQPWLWERLVRQHLEYLLQNPEAVDLLTASLARLDTQVVGRSWAVLSSQLCHVDPMVLCSAPALGNFQRAALHQITSCFRLISRDVLPSSGITNVTVTTSGTIANTISRTGSATTTTTTEVDITLSLQLPAALYTLLYLVGVTDQQGASSSYSDQGCVESAAVYTSMLLTELCTPESVYKMLQLENLLHQKKRNKSAKQRDIGNKMYAKKKTQKEEAKKDRDGEEEEEEEEETEPKLSFENISKIYSAMYTATVLIEAVLTSPQLAQSLSCSPTIENYKLTTVPPPTTQLTRIAVLLSIRWELAQLLAAAGITPGSTLFKSFSRSAPPVWSPQTCEAVIAAAVTNPGHQQQGSGSALTLPPAMLAHALELIQDALVANTGNYNNKNNSIEFLSQFLQRVMHVQEACATGVLTPHTAVHAGPGHHMSLAAARKLHALLLAEDLSATGNKKNLGKSVVGGQNGSKRNDPAAPAASKRRKKGTGVQESTGGPDAVAALMRMFTAGGRDPDAATAEEATTTAPAARTVDAMATSKTKPERKRITPQAIKNPETFSSISLLESDDQQEEEEEEEEYSDGEIEKAASGSIIAPTAVETVGGGTFGRVVMASTLDMDDATREAAWQAYIADKEKLVDMLGDSAYREWYDEKEHPLSAPPHTTRNLSTIDTFFDALFGSAGEAPQGNDGQGTHGLFGLSLPQNNNNILETSLMYPWQAALAASLQLALSILKNIAKKTTADNSETPPPPPPPPAAAAAVVLCQNLVSVEHRRASAAAVLKIVDPTHSRNTWLASSKGVELYPASGSVLHLVYQLRVLLLRTSRRTSPVMLAGYLALARFLLDTAAIKENEDAVMTTTTTTSSSAGTTSATRAPWLPLKYVGHTVKSFCCYPPLLAAAFNTTSAEALPRLAVAGVDAVIDRTAYAAGVLWLIVQSNTTNMGHRRAIRPEWLQTVIPEARSHPLVAAAPFIQSAAAVELLDQLAGEGFASIATGINDDDDGGDSIKGVVINSLMPLIDACAAAVFGLHLEQEHQQRQGNGSTQTTVLLGKSSSISPLASLSRLLMATFADSAEALAAVLDRSTTTTAAGTATHSEILLECEQRASFLGVGLEFTEVVSLVAPLLQEAETNSSSTMVLPVLERCTGVQGSCLELLRSLPEDSDTYLAAVRGLENAPVLALPPASDDDEEEEEEEDGGEEFADEDTDAEDGAGYDSDRVQLSSYERRKRLKDIRNPYLRVIVAESRQVAGGAADGELSDLEDFIVANPERDYENFIADHFPMAQESDGDEELDSEEEDERISDDGDGGAE